MRQIPLTPEQYRRKQEEFISEIQPYVRELQKLAENCGMQAEIREDGTIGNVEATYTPEAAKYRDTLRQYIELIRVQIFGETTPDREGKEKQLPS